MSSLGDGSIGWRNAIVIQERHGEEKGEEADSKADDGVGNDPERSVFVDNNYNGEIYDEGPHVE